MIIELNEAFSHITYSDKEHTYYNHNIQSELTSMTTYIKQWQHGFNRKAILPKSANKVGTTPEKLGLYWDYLSEKGVTTGSILHDYLENKFRRKTFPVKLNPIVDEKEMSKLFKLADDYYKSAPKDWVALELVMGNDLVAGQADKILKGKEGLILRDYKTGKIKDEHYGKYLKAPFSHIKNNTLGKYSLQLNGYAQLLKDAGFYVEKLEIVWFNADNDSAKIFQLPMYDIPWVKI